MVKNRASSISQIIEQRKPIVEKIESTIDQLTSLGTLLKKLEKLKQEILSKAPDKLVGILNQADISTLIMQIEDEQKVLTNLRHRFSRSTLNVGVVGRARQGKSRILQSISGLDSEIIPDGDGQHCTGVRSTISNFENNTETLVEFYDKYNFFTNIIIPYFTELDLEPHPIDIHEFEVSKIPKLADDNDPEKLAKFRKLEEIHHNFHKFQSLLTGISQIVDEKNIRHFVAQVNTDRKPIYNYLAVKHVKIKCKFPFEDLGQLTLIDMPGLGDTGLIDEENILKILTNEVDFMLFIRKPDNLGAVWEPSDLML